MLSAQYPLLCQDPAETEPGGGGLLMPRQSKWRHLITPFLKFFFFVFVLGFPATGSCHHRVLCCCPRTGGSGRDVFQQLLPLHALTRSSERRDGPDPVGAQWEADPRTAWQPVRLSGAQSGWAHTHTRRHVCVPSRKCQGWAPSKCPSNVDPQE